MAKSILFFFWIIIFSISCITGPDDKSGGDEDRHIAKEIPLGAWTPDSVSYAEGDRTDWKFVILPDPGIMSVEVGFDNEKTTIDVEVYDKYGKLVTKRRRRGGDEPQITLMSEVSRGKYFIKVQAKGENDKSGYSIKVSLK